MFIKKHFPLLLGFALLLVACGSDEDETSSGLRYTGTIPRFSVDPLDGSGVVLDCAIRVQSPAFPSILWTDRE